MSSSQQTFPTHPRYKTRGTFLVRYKFTREFSEKKVYYSQVSKGNKNRLDHESYYLSDNERLFHLIPKIFKMN